MFDGEMACCFTGAMGVDNRTVTCLQPQTTHCPQTSFPVFPTVPNDDNVTCDQTDQIFTLGLASGGSRTNTFTVRARRVRTLHRTYMYVCVRDFAVDAKLPGELA